MHMHMGESGMHMPMGALGMPMGAMGMPIMNQSKYSPAGRRPGAPVKIVWSVEEDQQLLQVLCTLHLALHGTYRVHSTWRVMVRSREGAPAAAPGPLHSAFQPSVLSCLLLPSLLAAGAHDRAALVGGRRAASWPRWQAVPRTVRRIARCIVHHTVHCMMIVGVMSCIT